MTIPDPNELARIEYAKRPVMAQRELDALVDLVIEHTSTSRRISALQKFMAPWNMHWMPCPKLPEWTGVEMAYAAFHPGETAEMEWPKRRVFTLGEKYTLCGRCGFQGREPEHNCPVPAVPNGTLTVVSVDRDAGEIVVK